MGLVLNKVFRLLIIIFYANLSGGLSEFVYKDITIYNQNQLCYCLICQNCLLFNHSALVIYMWI